MAFTTHRNRRVYPPNLYSPPDQPHHIHINNGCTDHRQPSCSTSHWIGGHPDADHPHHVEFDGETGQWGYTRLSDEEIRDLAHLDAFGLDEQRKEQEKKKAQDDLIRQRAKEDPAYAAIAELLGVKVD